MSILFDVVLSDLSPNVSGTGISIMRGKFTNFDFIENVKKLLKKGGHAVFKILRETILACQNREASKVFSKVTTSKPKASRQKK